MKTSRMVGVLLVMAALSLAFTTVAWADEAKKDAAPLTDKEFIEKAAQCNLAEIQLSQFAERQTSNANVRGFAQGIQRDHKMAQDKLKTVAAEGTTLPTELSAEHKKEVDRIKGLEGAEFDREYMKFMQESHRKAIDVYERAAKSATSPEVKRYAEDTLKVLRTHLDEAQKTAKTIGGE